MALPNKTFAQLVSDMVAAWSAAVGLTPALQPGDALYADMQATAGQMVFLEAQVQLVNAVARAQTSTGADLDSFMAQFGFTRLPATFNTGVVTFSKLTPAVNPVLVPAGTVVQTTGGAAQYQVVADTNQPTWNAAQNAYVLAPGQTSLTATVEALVAGTGPNVAAGALNQLASSLPGIDAVTNGSAINNGMNAESDTAFRARFVLYISSLSKATKQAILSAIANVQQGLFVDLLENETPGGETQLGEFTAVVDDGSGSPPAALITSVFNAVDLVRGFTIMPNVVAPTLIAPTISIVIRIAAGAVQSVVETGVQNAISAMIATLEPGALTLFISQVEAAALSVSGCQAVKSGQTKINGTAADLIMTAFQVPRTPISSITVGTY